MSWESIPRARSVAKISTQHGVPSLGGVQVSHIMAEEENRRTWAISKGIFDLDNLEK